jgi:hypothetical protein
MRLLPITLVCLFSANAFSHGMSAEDQASILNAGAVEYMRLGATHMLSGYDHLLFLFGVIFFLTSFRDIIKFITAFTIGHSITLVFATLLSLKANYYLIDTAIALTVCYKAFDNLDGFKKYFQMPSPNLTWMVFIFGLIHGFGLSTRLQQLPLGKDDLIFNILSFNVGVEVGQITALSVMLVILLAWKKTASFNRFSKAANVALMLIGGLLLLMQLHSYQHTTYPDTFPLNQDDHHHVHAAMAKTSSQLSQTAQEPASIAVIAPPISEPQDKQQEQQQEQQEQQQDKQPAKHSHDGAYFHSH